VGVNCTAPRHVEELIVRLRRSTTLPVVAYPNSGERWNAAARRWEGERSAEDFARMAERWRAAGALAVGGCCRVGPDYIRQL